MAIRLNMKKADRRATLAMTNRCAQDDKTLSLRTVLPASNQLTKPGSGQNGVAIRLNMKKADRRASLAMTNKYAQDDKAPVVLTVFLSF